MEAGHRQFKTVFEKEFMVKEVLHTLHLPVVLRLSMYGQPVATEKSSGKGKSPGGKRLQIEEPEQRFAVFCEVEGTDDPPR